MSHPFFKTAKVTEGAPSRLSNQSYERLKKKAHEIWDIDGSADEPEAIRKLQETAKVNYDAPATEMSVGDMVIFLLGGKRYKARVAAVNEDSVQVGKSGYWLPKWLAEKVE